MGLLGLTKPTWLHGLTGPLWPIGLTGPLWLIGLISRISRISRISLVQGMVQGISLVQLVLLYAPPASFPRRAGPGTPTAWAPVGHPTGRRNPRSTEKSGHVVISSTLVQRRASGIRCRRPATPVRHRDYTPPAPSFTGLAASPVTRAPCVKHMAAPACPLRTITDTGREVSLLPTTLRIPYRIMPNSSLINVLDSPCAPKVIFTAKRTDRSRIIRNERREPKQPPGAGTSTSSQNNHPGAGTINQRQPERPPGKRPPRAERLPETAETPKQAEQPQLKPERQPQAEQPQLKPERPPRAGTVPAGAGTATTSGTTPEGAGTATRESGPERQASPS